MTCQCSASSILLPYVAFGARQSILCWLVGIWEWVLDSLIVFFFPYLAGAAPFGEVWSDGWRVNLHMELRLSASGYIHISRFLY